jgi:hypothetical protein
MTAFTCCLERIDVRPIEVLDAQVDTCARSLDLRSSDEAAVPLVCDRIHDMQ